jgi:TolB-like protein
VLVGVDDLPRADAMTRSSCSRSPAPAAAGPVCGRRGDDGHLAAMPESAALLDVPALHRVALTPARPAGVPPDVPAEAAAAPPPAPAGRPWWRRRGQVAIGAAALGAIALGARGVVDASRTSTDAGAASLVAVAPFDVVDADLALWRHGVVDVLARRLDGAGALRTVSPTTVIRRFDGRGDPASAAALGARTGAGLVVYGGIVRAGHDSVRLEARLYDVRRAQVIGEVRVHDALAGMDRALDALGIGLLRELARARPLGAVRAAGVAAASLPALRAFLAAEQHYRAGAFDSAVVAAREAVALDSTFALAHHRLGTLLLYDQFLGTGARHLVRAGAAMHDGLVAATGGRSAAGGSGLASRDSVVVSLDSLRGATLLAGLARPDGVPPAELAGPYWSGMRRALLQFGRRPGAAASRTPRPRVHGRHRAQHAATSSTPRTSGPSRSTRRSCPAYVQAVGSRSPPTTLHKPRQYLASYARTHPRPGQGPAVQRDCSTSCAPTYRPTRRRSGAGCGRVAGDLAVSFLFLGAWPDPRPRCSRCCAAAEPSPARSARRCGRASSSRCSAGTSTRAGTWPSGAR